MTPFVPPFRPPLPERLLFGAVVLLVLWLPLPWGSHTAWAADLFCTLSFTMIALWMAFAVTGIAELPRGARRLLWPALLWLLWIGWIALQLVPLPPHELGLLSPAAADVHDAAARLAGSSPHYSLSISPSATGDGLLLSLGYCALYWLVVLTCAGSEARVRILLWAIVVSGTAQGFYGALMTLSGAEWGFFAKKVWYLENATGTFVNRNHFAGYLELAGAAALALILADLQVRKAGRTWRQVLRDWITLMFSDRIRVRVALALMVAGLVLSRSRMGNMAFFASLTLCGIFFIALRERALAWRAAILFLGLLAVDAWIVSRWFGFEELVERIETTDVGQEGRTQLLTEIPPVIGRYALTGSGLGTFALAYAPYRSAAMREHFDHAHNDYLELLIDVGLPGLAILLSFAGIHLLHALRLMVLRRRRLAAATGFAAFMALTATAIHAAVEFNLQIPANAATLVVLLALAACWAPRGKSRSPGGAVPDAHEDRGHGPLPRSSTETL